MGLQVQEFVVKVVGKAFPLLPFLFKDVDMRAGSPAII
jgi:hypothetical protein